VVRARRILTMDGDPAEALVVDGGRVLEAGGRELLTRRAGADVVDLGDRTVVPGLIDAHNHLSLAALQPLWVDATDVGSPEELAAHLHAAAEAADGVGGWVRAFGWHDDRVPLTRSELDEIGPDVPVVLAHFSYHQCLVNSRALDELGISESTPAPPGGEHGRGADGRLDGYLIERAWSVAHARSLAPSFDPDRWGELFARRARTLLRYGITAVHDAACSPAAEAVYRQLARDGALPISVLMNPHPSALLSDLDTDRLAGPVTGEGDHRVRVGPVKLFADGGSHPAIHARIGGREQVLGVAFPSVAEQVEAAVDRGFGVSVHVMGNLALDEVLDAFEEAADRAPVLRIEHATMAAPHHIHRMAELGVVAVVQPGFVPLLAGLAARDLDLLGAELMPFGSLVAGGVTIAGSSDDPCDPGGVAPLTAATYGASRLLPSGDVVGAGQAVDQRTWLRAYTRGAAVAGGQEAERGALRPGARADFVVLDGEVGDGPPPAVVQTWVGGEVVWEDAPAAP
jgi:predicted amidohydrolase YtcJ